MRAWMRTEVEYSDFYGATMEWRECLMSERFLLDCFETGDVHDIVEQIDRHAEEKIRLDRRP